jgi:hypothetical protein
MPAEIAWTAQGEYVGDADAKHAGFPWVLEVPHNHRCKDPRAPDGGDNEDTGRKCGVFICARCGRAVPWCFGAAGEEGFEQHCDDCWAACTTALADLVFEACLADGISKAAPHGL